MRKIKQKNKRSKKDKKRLSRHEDFVMAREPPKLESPTQIYPMDLSTPSCSRWENVLIVIFFFLSEFVVIKYLVRKSKKKIWRDSKNVCVSIMNYLINIWYNSLQSCFRFGSGLSSLSNSRYHIELPQTTRSTVELSNNGHYTSVQIETSGGLAGNLFFLKQFYL